MAENVVELTEMNFEREVAQADRPVMVDFWAGWCQPCRMLSPVVEEVAKDAAARCKVGKLNVDDHPQLAARFNVMSIPTLIFFKQGREVDRVVGVIGKPEIVKRIDKLG